jgi:hypothetical protein
LHEARFNAVKAGRGRVAVTGVHAMMRIEIWVFTACAAMLVAWMAFGPERYVHRSQLPQVFHVQG